MNPCEPYEDLLSAQLDGALTAQEQAALNAHLETCPHCRAYARDLQTLHASLPTLAADPPDRMAASILKETASRPAKKTRRWAVPACAAVLALALLGSAPLLFGNDPAGDAAGEAHTGQAADSAASAGEDLSKESAAPAETARADAAPQASGESAPPLTQQAARTALEAQLAEAGRDLRLEPGGLSDDGESWIFSAEEPDGTAAALFFVARDSGAVRELPAAAPAPPP